MLSLKTTNTIGVHQSWVRWLKDSASLKLTLIWKLQTRWLWLWFEIAVRDQSETAENFSAHWLFSGAETVADQMHWLWSLIFNFSLRISRQRPLCLERPLSSSGLYIASGRYACSTSEERWWQQSVRPTYHITVPYRHKLNCANTQN